MDTKEVISKALDVINERGWTQYSFHAEDGAMCISAALVEASYDFNINMFTNMEKYDKARIVLEELINVNAKPGHEKGMISWNDTPGRTRDDVVRLLKEAQE